MVRHGDGYGCDDKPCGSMSAKCELNDEFDLSQYLLIHMMNNGGVHAECLCGHFARRRCRRSLAPDPRLAWDGAALIMLTERTRAPLALLL